MTAPAEGPVESGGHWSPSSVVSGTSARFTLLVFAILTTSAQLFTVLYLLVPGRGRDVLNAQATCERRYQERVSGLDLRYDIEALVNDGAMEKLRQAKQEQWACAAGEYREMAYWVLGGLAVVLLAAGLLYVVTPIWKQSRPGVTRLPAGKLSVKVAELLEQAELPSQAVSFVVSTPSGGKGGLEAVTYGRPGRYVVVLDAGLFKWYGSKDSLHRSMVSAVLLHELAHIRNRDVSVGGAASALWRAFLVVGFVSCAVIVPFGAGTIPAGELVAEIARLTVFAVISLCAYASVARLRELHADVGAVVCVPDAKNGLLKFVVDHARPSRGGIARPFELHPSPELRREVIESPRVMLRAGVWESVGVGWVGMAAATGGVQYGALFMPVWAAEVLVAGVVSVFLVGALTAVVGRTTVLAEHPGKYRLPFRALLGLGCGMLVGDPLSMSLNLRYWGSLGHWPELSPGAAVVSGVLLSIALLLVTAWLASIAVGWVFAGDDVGGPTSDGLRWGHPHRRHSQLSVRRRAFPRWAWACATAVASLVFAPFFLTWLRAHDDPRMITWTWSHTARVAGQRGWDYWEGPANTWLSLCYAPFQSLQHNPLVLPALFVIALVPLLSGRRPPLGSLAMTGVVGGLCLIAGQVMARTLLYRVFPGTVAHPGFSAYYIHCQVAFSVLGMAVVGGVVLARRWPAAASLLAALLTGTISAIAIPALGFDAAQGLGEVKEFGGFTVSVLRPILFQGALAVGVATLLVRTAQAVEPDVSQEFTSPRLLRYGALSLAILAAHMAFAVATQAPSYRLPDDPCAAVDISSVHHHPGEDPTMSTAEAPLEPPADRRRTAGKGMSCALVLEGNKGILRVNVTMSLPADGRTGALRVLYAAKREGECRDRRYQELEDVGTLAWGSHAVARETSSTLPDFRSEYVVCVQDGGLFLYVRVTLYRDTAPDKGIDFEVKEVATKTMTRLSQESRPRASSTSGPSLLRTSNGPPVTPVPSPVGVKALFSCSYGERTCSAG